MSEVIKSMLWWWSNPEDMVLIRYTEEASGSLEVSSAMDECNDEEEEE